MFYIPSIPVLINNNLLQFITEICIKQIEQTIERKKIYVV